MYERSIGEIPKGYELHHIDCNPSNNLLNNLVALPKSIHQLIHENIKAFPNKQSIRVRFPDLTI